MMGLRDVTALSQRLARAQAEVARLTAAERKARRAADNRSKIIAGAVVLAAAKRDPGFRAVLRGLLEAAELRQGDVALFDDVFGGG